MSEVPVNYLQQIKELNTYMLTRVAPSKIAGVGIFALRDLEKGETLYADMASKIYTLPYKYFDPIRPEVRTLIVERWPQVINGSPFVFPDTRLQAFMNHSDTPNYNGKTDIMLKNVEEGEEITEDYRQIEGYQQIFGWLDK